MDERRDDTVMRDALGLVPGGVFLMTSCYQGSRAGLLVTSVQVCAWEPAMLCVAARKGHAIDPLIRDSRTFAIGVVDPGDTFISRRFGARLNGVGSAMHVEGSDPFDAMTYSTLVTQSPLLPQCATWFDCELVRRLDLESDHELFVGQVLGVVHAGSREVVELEA
jgi:flavin reductase (DIM6/NTAB) family NADH-FMN oxidoreductase RutF